MGQGKKIESFLAFMTFMLFKVNHFSAGLTRIHQSNIPLLTKAMYQSWAMSM